MTTSADLLPTAAAPSVPPLGGGAYNAIDDEDDAGYQAMMSELPTIVSMSGLLDGDFDELNEIQNLLAPVSDDDDEGLPTNADAAAAAAEAAEDAYIQAMVPNPIPTDDYMTGMDVSATAAALDENLGFPSAALVTTPAEVNPPGLEVAAPSPLAVKAPSKRVHNQLDSGLVTPHSPPHIQKKIKRESHGSAQTPATLRTSLDGVSAPNPLLFGRPIQIPSQAALEPPRPSTSKPKVTKVTLKPKVPLRPTRPPSTVYPPVKPSKNKVPPKPRKPTNPLVPEIITSYPVPSFLFSKMKDNRPPLCKVTFRGKIDPVVDSSESPIVRVLAPPKKQKQKQETGSKSATNKRNDSATASKKKASNSKKKKPTKAKKKSSTTKAKKVGAKSGIKTTTKEGTQKKSITDPSKSNKTETEKAPPASAKPKAPQVEELMVANPLANVPPAAPMKMPVPQKPKATPGAGTDSKSQPAVVSSNSSEASESPEELTSGGCEVKKPSSNGGKPLTAEEKAQACRDRNRQHARNTRLRKKAYVEELKRSLTDLVEQRDRDQSSQQDEKSKKEKLRSSRKRALQDFLKLRGHNVREEAKWSQLVKDPKAFRLTLPATKFQTTVQNTTASSSEQVLVGIQDVMTDASYFASFLQSLGTSAGGNNEIQTEKSPIYFEYNCAEMPLLIDGTMGLLTWKAKSHGAVSQGAKAELQLNGTIRADFCPETEKLVSVIILFDTGVIQAQLPHSL